MKPIVKHLILILILVAVYFATDFLEKGIILNDITPYPIIGIIFWLLLIYVVFVVIIQPILQFRKLKTIHEISITSNAEKLCKKLEKHKLEKRDEEHWQSEIWYQLNEELLKKCPKNSEQFVEREKRLAKIIDNYIKQDNEKNKDNNINSQAKKIINQYSWSAALCVIFSRNSFLDGMLMLFAQMKMTVDLAKLYGYKPSPLFNSLCFGWIATNSILTGLFAQAGADTIGEVLTDSLTNGDIVEGGLTNTVISKMGSLAVEGLASATTVYVTGYVVLMKLQGTAEININTLFRLRREGRWELVKNVPQNTIKALSAKIPDFSSTWEKIKNSVMPTK